MDGPGGATDLEVTAEETFLIRSPKDLPKALVGIKALIKGDEVLSKYAKVKELEWYKGASNFGKVLARGLSSEVLQGVLFGAAEGEGTLRSAAIRLAASNPGPVRDALLPILKKAAAPGGPKVVDPLKKLKAVAAQLKFPSSSTVDTRYNSISYYKKGGHALFKVQERVLEAARSLGFVEKSSSPHSVPDGSNIGGSGVKADAEGNVLRIGYNIGSTAYDNWLSLDLSLKK